MNGPLRKPVPYPHPDREKLGTTKSLTPTITIAGISISLCTPEESENKGCEYGGCCNPDSECNLFAFPNNGALCQKLVDNPSVNLLENYINESTGSLTELEDGVRALCPAPSSESKDWVTPANELEVVQITSEENIGPNLLASNEEFIEGSLTPPLPSGGVDRRLSRDYGPPVGTDEEEINTKEIAQRITDDLKRYNVFAHHVVCRTQGTLSDLLRKPKPWSKLKSGRETFLRMWRWLQEPESQRMSTLLRAARCTGELHPRLQCGECGGAIVGFRYKCVSCAEYNLCAACEGEGMHAHHVMMRFSRPIKFQTARELLLAWRELLKAKDLLSPYEDPRIAKSGAKQTVSKTIKSAKSTHNENDWSRYKAKSNNKLRKKYVTNDNKSIKRTGKLKECLSKIQRNSDQSKGKTSSDSQRWPSNVVTYIKKKQKQHEKLLNEKIKMEEKTQGNRNVDKALQLYLKNVKNKLLIMPKQLDTPHIHSDPIEKVVVLKAACPEPIQLLSDTVLERCDEYATTVPRPPVIKTYSRTKRIPAPPSNDSNCLSVPLPTNCIGANSVQPEDVIKRCVGTNEAVKWIKQEVKVEVEDTPNGAIHCFSLYDYAVPTAVRIKEEPDPL